LAGLWLIWSTWATAAGWILSLMDQLNGTGYLAASLILFASCIGWWRHTATARKIRWGGTPFRGKRRWLSLCFKIVAVLSLASALLFVPWSFDAVTYRLPRCLYWLAENHWYWIGTIDGRLDYSACGLEWQMIPLLLVTKSDRFLFLLSYLPFLLLPGLTYLGGRTLGVARKPLLVWMWLLPCAYCIALQCSGLCNDGYSTTYTVACLAFAGVAIRRKDRLACVFSGLAAALLTGAKLSNLPLMLPLGIVFLVAAWNSGFFKLPAVGSLMVMALVSFLPLAYLSQTHTGDWTGDPGDQWGFRTGNPVAAAVANLLLTGNDLVKPPVLVGTEHINRILVSMQSSVPWLMEWLSKSHRMFNGLGFGDMIYEGDAGAGFSIGVFLIAGTLIGFAMRGKISKPRQAAWQTVALLSGIAAWLVLLMQLGSSHTPRNAATYLPLLLFACSRLAPLRRFMHSKGARLLALFGMASVIPIIILTPARPLIPLSFLEKYKDVGPVGKALGKYKVWEKFRDDLKPMRDHLPDGEKVIGYAGAFRDTSYGLWKPLFTKTLPELGIPLKNPQTHAPVPNFVVATAPGIRQRFDLTVEDWAARERKEIVYSFNRSKSLDADSPQDQDTWYLLGPINPKVR